MTQNPVLNALAAALYVAGVATLLHYAGRLVGGVDTLLAPIAFLSLFVLSAAVMGFVFLYQPLHLYFQGDRSRSVTLFLQTVGLFGAITLALIAALLVVGRMQATV
jgi:hypothetical protein